MLQILIVASRFPFSHLFAPGFAPWFSGIHRVAIEAPDPISAIHHVMEARGLRQKDLAALIGSQSHASEVLRRRRPLSLAMIRVLAREWSLPADVLVREYELATA